MDELGIDVLLTGSQKALACLPASPSFPSAPAPLSAPPPARPAATISTSSSSRKPARGHDSQHPSIGHVYALQSKLDDIFAEGVNVRYARHARLNGKVAAWVQKNGFEFFAAEGYRSKSLTCVRNNREIDVPSTIQKLRERYHCVIDGGYGKIKGKTFRISNMGDETDQTIETLLGWLDDCIA